MKSGILIWIALLIVLPPPVGGAPKFSEWGTAQKESRLRRQFALR